MRLTVAFILSIIFAVGLVAFGFTFFQSVQERNRLKSELENNCRQISKEIINDYAAELRYADTSNFHLVSGLITKRYSLFGVAVYNSEDSILSNLKDINEYAKENIIHSINADIPIGDIIRIAGKKIYQYSVTIDLPGLYGSALVLFTDAGYMDELIERIWFRNFVRWFIQAFIVTLITLFIVRWGVFAPINRMVDWTKSIRSGDMPQLKHKPFLNFLDPLHQEIRKIAKALQEAKASAEEEARLRTSAESVWTPERLKAEIELLLPDQKIIVVSNREPYMHIREGKEIKTIVPASGMVTAMEPILKASGGLWIAAGTGDADKETVDKNDSLKVPPEEPKYTLKRLWLTKAEEFHFYYGFSNEGLWPLCHIAHTRPTFRIEDWQYYKKVNAIFAQAVLNETSDEKDPIILIQDFHFALLPEMIKKEKPDARIAIFWHIPWPNPESFSICPWQKEILKGMLGADLIGFHTQYHCNHFLETVRNTLESRVLWDNFCVKMGGNTTYVKPFPISIAFSLKDNGKESHVYKPSDVLEKYGIKARFMGVGVDRIDYTKGIIEKFLAIERFLLKYPYYQGKFTFVQIGAPSRTLLKSYSDMVSAVESEAERINERIKSRNKAWKPILLLKKHHSHEEIAPFYTSSNFCMVTSLHDGMNLVAKEFVAARSTNDGCLILSTFTGAAQELQGAIKVNPYDIEKSADAIKEALEMNPEEQSRRMKQMRITIARNNIYSWAANLLRTIITIS